MRARTAGVVAVIAIGLIATGCSAFDDTDDEPNGLQSFCDLAEPVTLEARVRDLIEPSADEPEGYRDFIENFYSGLLDDAPSEIRAEVEAADGLYRRAVDGDATVLDDPALASTSGAIADYVERACRTDAPQRRGRAGQEDR